MKGHTGGLSNVLVPFWESGPGKKYKTRKKQKTEKPPAGKPDTVATLAALDMLLETEFRKSNVLTCTVLGGLLAKYAAYAGPESAAAARRVVDLQCWRAAAIGDSVAGFPALMSFLQLGKANLRSLRRRRVCDIPEVLGSSWLFRFQPLHNPHELGLLQHCQATRNFFCQPITHSVSPSRICTITDWFWQVWLVPLETGRRTPTTTSTLF